MVWIDTRLARLPGSARFTYSPRRPRKLIAEAPAPRPQIRPVCLRAQPGHHLGYRLVLARGVAQHHAPHHAPPRRREALPVERAGSARLGEQRVRLLRDLRRDRAAEAVDWAARVEHGFVEAPPVRAFLSARDQHAVRLEALERRAFLQAGRRERLRRAPQHAMDVVRGEHQRQLPAGDPQQHGALPMGPPQALQPAQRTAVRVQAVERADHAPPPGDHAASHERHKDVGHHAGGVARRGARQARCPGGGHRRLIPRPPGPTPAISGWRPVTRVGGCSPGSWRSQDEP